MRTEERGISGLFILVILVLAALAVLATVALHRTTDSTAELHNAAASLAKAGAALEAFAGASGRLPCPANPAVDDGVELPPGGAKNCQYPQGTLPWATIGLRRDDAYDSWGHKISYRVYSGNTGFTQAGGMSMTNCDSVVGKNGTDADGLCRTDHTTVASAFVSGKGLTITDFGATYDATKPTGGAAYVLISHGPTGLGSYTASGVQLDLPKNDEKDNTLAAGPFHIEAFSDSNTSATAASHFDDLLYYRTVTALVNATGLEARTWAGVLSAVTFDKNTLTAALGSSPSSDTGRTTIAFSNATVSGFDSGGSQDISYVHGGGHSDAIGGVNGGDGLLSSAGSEGLRIDFSSDARQFAFTVDQFDDNAAVHERLQLRFYEVAGATATLRATQNESSCGSNGKVTSFTVDACAKFNRVEIVPITATDGASASTMSLAEIRTCIDSVACATDLQSTGNVCSSKSFSPCSMGAGSSSTLKVTLANPTGSSMTAVAFSDAYPPGLANVASPTITNTCGGTVTATGGGTTLALANGVVPLLGCMVTIGVTASTPAAYSNSTGNITTASPTLAAVSGTLNVLVPPSVGLGFAPAAVSANSRSVHSVTLGNSNVIDITGAAFSESLPSGLVSDVASATSSCGGSAVAVNSPTPTLTLSGGVIPAAGSCIVSVNVTSSAIGSYTAAIAAGTVTATNAGTNPSGASASLSVN